MNMRKKSVLEFLVELPLFSLQHKISRDATDVINMEIPTVYSLGSSVQADRRSKRAE
jgi:hypothetical protein